MVHSLVRSLTRRLAPLAIGATTIGATVVSAPAATAAITFHPAFSDIQLVKVGEVPPSQADCAAINRRCFNPTSETNSYNLGPLYAQNLKGQGQTIVLVDSFGSQTMRHDLNVFNTQFNLPHMCGEANYTCQAGDPTYSELQQGNTSTKPTGGKGTGQEDRSAWAIEVALDVEWAHSIAPLANILLVTTPTAETLGVQGFPDFFKAEDYVITHHLGSVISQSFASAEDAFNGQTSLLNLRYAFQHAVANHVTVFGSSGDGGTSNTKKSPVGKGGTVFPFPTVEWPASDPLVTGVGGTYECTNPVTGSLTADQTEPPNRCKSGLNPTGDRELGWIASGGGYSHVFAKPSFQNALPAGSTAIGASRGVPDIALQASATTGVLIYITNPGYGSNVSDTGWYVIGGTSSSSPQWAGLIAIGNQLNQRLHPGAPNLGYINPLLYQIASNPARYAADFFDITHGPLNNPAPTAENPGYPSTTGWDPVTGLGTPNAANLLPDLVAAANS